MVAHEEAYIFLGSPEYSIEFFSYLRILKEIYM